MGRSSGSATRTPAPAPATTGTSTWATTEISFGVYPGGVRRIAPPGFNDGAWHHLVAAVRRTAWCCTSTVSRWPATHQRPRRRPTPGTGVSAGTTRTVARQRLDFYLNGAIDEVASTGRVSADAAGPGPLRGQRTHVVRPVARSPCPSRTSMSPSTDLSPTIRTDQSPARPGSSVTGRPAPARRPPHLCGCWHVHGQAHRDG